MNTQPWSIALVILSTVLSSLGSFYLKLASKGITMEIKTIISNVKLYTAVSFHFTSAILGVIAYRGGELTVLVPLASFSYIWASILAVRYLGEQMNKWKWIGIGCIMMGVTLIGLGDVL